MKVFIPAIYGLVPDQMVSAVATFTRFCYLVRRHEIGEASLDELGTAVEQFHRERQVFVDEGVREDFHLPRQHAMMHYQHLIQRFGAPNGLCTSITESKHIKAVKEPYRRSNKNEPLGQMLLTNQRIDKLAAARVQFGATNCLLPLGVLAAPLDQGERMDVDEEEDEEDAVAAEGVTCDGDVKLARYHVKAVPKTLDSIGNYFALPQLHDNIRRYLHDYGSRSDRNAVFGMDMPIDHCPWVNAALRIKVFPSAVATYHAPSDLSGIGGMHRERIRSTPSWKNGPPRHDCVLLERQRNEPGFKGLLAAQVLLFFSFSYEGEEHACAYVHWFERVGDEPHPVTGMWQVRPDFNEAGNRLASVVSVDNILRGVHLLPVFAEEYTDLTMTFSDTLYAFHTYFINRYSDYHANEIAY